MTTYDELAAHAVAFSDHQHAAMVAELAKPGREIVAELTPEKAHLWHMASALMGEAGELFDAVKKCAVYGKDLDVDNVVEELGDIEFYLEGLRQQLRIDRTRTLDANIAKLRRRYPGRLFRNADAQARADKSDAAPSAEAANADAM